jgi:periplasmic protein TonB
MYTDKEQRDNRRNWRQVFNLNKRSQMLGAEKEIKSSEVLDRLKVERSRSHVHFLIGLGISILLVQGAFGWKGLTVPQIDLPTPETLTIEVVELAPVLKEKTEKLTSESQPAAKEVILDLSQIQDPNNLLTTSKDEPIVLGSPDHQRGDEGDEPDPFETSNPIATRADVNPEFPGGMPEFDKFLKDNIRYPQRALDSGVNGEVVVSFVVDTAGNLSDLVIKSGLPYGMDQEVLRVMAQSPRWIPGSIKGHPVAVRYQKSVRFVIKP